ncbi:hypothetical protein P5V67_04115 [Mycobacteroides abscessus subsp. abscessus]|uniref:hypothetical protein n=1 Tax=Mycobacteroides abscessus TaxID=36809 RepID=UPI00266B74B1|nr:hypothetical protein [Mycobacteroides abscessus]MDO3244281.1 hypothetical protein [Mycobacteroides abscessus subsp. abscessus]MDO3349805.1 hypothetical protein [Mycobacteroides abscessus subsp. abscessus]
MLKIRSALLLALAILISILILLLVFGCWSWLLFIPVALIAVSVVAYFSLSWRHYTTHRDRELRKRMFPDVDVIKAVRDSYRPHMTKQEVYEFLRSIRAPAEVVERISESVEIQTRVLLVNTVSTFTVQPSLHGGGRCVLPVDYIMRGHLVDGLEIYGSSNERVSSYSRNQAAGFMLAALTEYLSALGESTLDKFQSTVVEIPVNLGGGDTTSLTLEEAVIQVIGADRPWADTEIQCITDQIFMLPHDASKEPGLLDCATVIRELASHYPLLAELSITGASKAPLQVRASAIKRVIPFRNSVAGTTRPKGRRSTGGVIDTVINFPRRVLGVQPALVSYPVANSRRAQSYHIEIKGPEGTYLGRQRVVKRPNGTEIPLDNIRCAMQPRFGQRHSHLYVHSAVDLRNAYFENCFFERVPGSVGRATITALAAMVLITLCAITKLGIGYVKGTDLLAVLLALPAAAATWAGFGERGRITGDVLVSRVSQIGTLTASLLTAWLFAVLPSIERNEHSFSVHDVTSSPWGWLWALIVMFEGAGLVAIAACWVFRSLVQGHFVRRERVPGK